MSETTLDSDIDPRLAAKPLDGLDDTALDNLIENLMSAGRVEEALGQAQSAVEAEPERPTAHYRLARALQTAQRHLDAIPLLRRVMAMDPELPELRNRLAVALTLTGQDSPEALDLLETAVQADPRDVNAWINLARSYRVRKRLAEALNAGARAVQAAPNNSMASNNYSLALKEAQRWDEAEHFAEKALLSTPGADSYAFNLAILRLVRGDYARGWPGHETRWTGAIELKSGRPALPGSRWMGEPLEGKTLLLWGEQGFGDVLQFCRYAPLLADYVRRRGGRLVWNSFVQLGDLFPRSFEGHFDEYCNGGVSSLPPFDYEISMLSLPLFFETRAHNLPAPTLLKPDPAAAMGWRKRLARERRLKVGLTWTGSATHQRNPFRRVGLERYVTAFAGMGNVAFYSLQKDAGTEVAAARAQGFDIVDHTAEFANFDDTAAFVGELDLVITVCTSIAHLSGAMGKPTWVLLDTNPHWVWLLDRRDSPWYPSATLYRQKQFDDWNPPFEDLVRDLRVLAGWPR